MATRPGLHVYLLNCLDYTDGIMDVKGRDKTEMAENRQQEKGKDLSTLTILLHYIK
jgi:hypothetical protein